MNTKAKGSRNERRTILLLENLGYRGPLQVWASSTSSGSQEATSPWCR